MARHLLKDDRGGDPRTGGFPRIDLVNRKMCRTNGTRWRAAWLAIFGLVATAWLSGCGSQPGYPTAKPAPVLGQPGECVYCHRKIERVTEDNLVTYDGVQYIVCDEKCAAAQKIAAER